MKSNHSNSIRHHGRYQGARLCHRPPFKSRRFRRYWRNAMSWAWRRPEPGRPPLVLPILERLLKEPRGRVRALIIAPTRELAEQTHVSIVTLGRDTKLRSATIYGGVAMNPQIQKLAGVEIVVACPGRLLDHLKQGRRPRMWKCSCSMRRTACSTWDSCHGKIFRQVPAKRQTLLFWPPCPMISGSWPRTSSMNRSR